MPTNTKKQPQSMLYVTVFVGIFLVIVMCALVYKVANLYIHRNFTDTSFTFVVLENDAFIVKVDELDNSVSMARVTDITPKFYQSSKRYQQVYLGVPLEGRIVFRDRPSDDHFNKNFFSFPHLVELLLRRDKIYFSHINTIDLLKIYSTAWFAKNWQSATFDLKNFDASVFLSHHMDEHLSDLFRDRTIFNEAVSIEVDNATSTNGLGSLVSGMLKDVGYNVVFVTSKKPSAKTRIISRAGESVTLDKLQHIFNVPVSVSTISAQADINIIIGEDFFK